MRLSIVLLLTLEFSTNKCWSNPCGVGGSCGGASGVDPAFPYSNGDIGDWTLLFGQWNLLPLDLKISQFTRDLGWLGMAVTIAFLAHRTYRDFQPVLRPLELHK